MRDKRKETQERNTQRQMLRDRFSNSVKVAAESSFEQVQVMSLIAEELNADSRDCKWDYTYDEGHLSRKTRCMI